MTSFSIRKAQSQDAQPIREHMVRVLAEDVQYFPLAQDEYDGPHIPDILESENSIVLLAEVQGQIVGMLECKGSKTEAMRHVTNVSISVRNGSRNQGVGSALLAEAITWARATSKVKRIELFVYARNKAAIHLYKKFGFEIEGCCRRAILQNNEYLDDLIMALLL